MKSKLQKIEDVEFPELGKYYLVRCAVLKLREDNERLDLKDIEYCPVIGMEHTCNEIGNHPKHIHIDGRFKNGYAYMEDGRTNRAIYLDERVEFKHWENGGYDFVGYEYRRKKLINLGTGLFVEAQYKQVTKYAAWYDLQIGKKCKGICPTKGKRC